MRSALSLIVVTLLCVPVVHAQSEAPAPSSPAPAGEPAKPAQPAQPPEDPYLTNYKKFEHRDERAPGRGPQGKRIGFGLMLGRPVGITAKVFFTQTIAFQLELGATYNPWFGPEVGGQAQVVWHPQNLYTHEQFKLSWYIGGGGRFGVWPLVPFGVPSWVPHLDPRNTRPAFVWLPNADSFPGTLGLQATAGLALHLTKVPVELYAQPVVTVDLFPGITGDLGATVGARWYFF